MKYKLITTLLCISIMSITACGKPAETVSKTNIVPSTEAEVNTETNSTVSDQETSSEWIELGYLDDYPEFRAKFDELVGNRKFTDEQGEEYSGKKGGFCYVNMDNKWTNNSTLRYTFNQSQFLDKVWNNSDALNELKTETNKIFTDIENDNQARLAAINTYFNLFKSNGEKFNGSQSLTRAEFLTGVYKAHNPVVVLDSNIKLSIDTYNPFVNQMLPYSFINLTEDTSAYNTGITRGEAIYTIVVMYYKDNFDAVDTDTPNFYTDATKVLNKNGMSNSDQIAYILKNGDAGVPADIYRALCVAAANDLIDNNESRWYDIITKEEALELITKVYEDSNANIHNVLFNVGATKLRDESQQNNAENQEHSEQQTNTEDIQQSQVDNNESQTNNSGEQSNNNQNQQGQTDNNTQTVKNHIVMGSSGRVAASKELKQAIKDKLQSYGVSTDYTNTIIYEYYTATQGKDNTVIHNSIINNLVSSITHLNYQSV